MIGTPVFDGVQLLPKAKHVAREVPTKQPGTPIDLHCNAATAWE